MPDHPIFDDIGDGDLAAVQQRVLADAAVLEERMGYRGWTPLILAILRNMPAIALWIIQHRGEHDLNTADDEDYTALHYASKDGALAVVRALVAAGANPAAPTGTGYTPLVWASYRKRPNIVAFLLHLPAVKASIDHINEYQWTALSRASADGYQRIVELLLDAGADPTIPAGEDSPLNQAISNNRHAIARLLAGPDRALALHKARCLLGAGADRARALHDARSVLDAGGAAALACLQDRVEQGRALPWVELTTPLHKHCKRRSPGNKDAKHEKLWATAAFAVGVSGGEKDTGLCEDLYMKLQEYMLPFWACNGLEDDDSESSSEESGPNDEWTI